MSTQRCCSERHGKILCNREGRATRRAPSYSSPWDTRRRANWQRRRVQKLSPQSAETIDRGKVGDRDGWRCFCGRKINPNLPYPHPRSPSIDHVIPISEGGPHTYANVRIAHLACNVARGNRGGNEQLILFGEVA